ncbi:MAG: dimethyl sulfoxide reductase anchor subunit [Planctomycetaceae bacterium]|nr:dimethyl sulfoxide reductase anchor subunit [Planctomycetaceae bacterium]
MTTGLLPIVDPPPASHDDLDLVKRLLNQQKQLTAVEAFSSDHEAGLPEQARYYSKLLPTSLPEAGQQYAFEVDLDRCSGCKACVTACHSLNGLDEQETWRDVGLLMGGSQTNPVMQHVTTACHHCLEPGCMTACPVDAYEKDPITGIVKHLDDQCFGCQYCTLACPYDVPKYHAGKGIVRKCDMCSDRLADGEAPACVQACPHEAISIKVVETQQVIENAEIDHFLPAAPDPQITLPTTNYKTSRVFPKNTLPTDYHDVNPQHPHWPLIIMLVLTQLSVGAFLVGMLLEHFLSPSVLPAFRQLHASNALFVGLIALGASTLHLGRPQYAYRAVIGLRHSWLSREIVAFGVFAASAMLFASLAWFSPTSSWLPLVKQGVAISGLSGLFCSIMIYVFTGREFWSFGRTLTKFCLTAVMLGVSATLSSITVYRLFIDPASQDWAHPFVRIMLSALMISGAMKLFFEAVVFHHLLSRRQSPLKRSAQLMLGPLKRATTLRFLSGGLGTVFIPLILMRTTSGGPLEPSPQCLAICLSFLFCFSGELIERYQFFSACASPRMPGALRS